MVQAIPLSANVGQTRPSARRSKIIQALEQQAWFQQSEPEVRQTLITLPTQFWNNAWERTEELYWDDVLEALLELHAPGAHLPMGAPRLISIEKALIDSQYPYGMSLIGLVQYANGITAPRQWFTWHRGIQAGGKGVLLVRNKETGRMTHLVILRGVSVPLQQVVFDCPGGGREGDETPAETFVGELEEELSIPREALIELYDLGTFLPDSSAMFQAPGLLAGVISDATYQECIVPNLRSPQEIRDLDEAPTPVAFPIETVGEQIQELSRDAYCAVILLRLHAYQRALKLSFHYPGASPKAIDLSALRPRRAP